MTRRGLLYATGAIGILVTLMICVLNPSQYPSLWFTPDQQADHLMRRHKYAEAAKVYTVTLLQGVAYYRAGDFQSAAEAFSQGATPESVYNHATALVMLGKYDAAVKTYDRALVLRPNWKQAEDNREIAKIRRDRLKMSGGDESGGQMKADQVVYEKGAKKTGETIQVDNGPALNNTDLQALWLRRVQTKPADFLRAKFAFQSAQQTSESAP